jgi:rRNA maturation RNase YbeY
LTYESELSRVIAHGILHLIGFKDKTKEEAAVMRSKEDEVLAYLEKYGS